MQIEFPCSYPRTTAWKGFGWSGTSSTRYSSEGVQLVLAKLEEIAPCSDWCMVTGEITTCSNHGGVMRETMQETSSTVVGLFGPADFLRHSS